MANNKHYSWVTVIITALYLLVHFVPDMGGADVMGAQWLYSSVLDLVVLFYIYINRSHFKEAVAAVLNYKFTFLFSLLVLWAMGSYFYAINATETLVTLARLLTTYLIFINLSILYFKQDIRFVFNAVSLLVSIVLLHDALYVIKGFTTNLETMSLDQNIINLTGNNGNKNVMAASLLIKFPFTLYFILNQKYLGKLFALITVFFGVFALFILNTRSTFVGLGIITLLFICTSVYFLNWKHPKKWLVQIAYLVLPIIVAYFSANFALKNAIDLQGFQGGYGTVAKRVGDITVASEQNSRIHLWEGAIDYATKHPILGAGYGNWKLASIPYEKEFTNDLFVPYHSHNDFIEMFADLGIVGGLSFAGMFLLMLLFTIKIWRDKSHKQYTLMATISFMAITCYFVDAFLNFPAERTSMQTMLAMSAALVLMPAAFIYPSAKLLESTKTKFYLMHCLVGLLIITPSIYINYQTYQSLKVQKFVMGEIDADPKMPLEDVKDAFPSIPNLSTSTLPIKGLVARYYFRDKQYAEALQLLNESENVNPYLHYNDFIRTAIYASLLKYDSAFYYSKKAFYNWPRATSYYKNVIFAAAKMQDTVEIEKAFKVYVKYRNDAQAWNQYLLGMYEVKKGASVKMKLMLDTALVKFPADAALFSNIKSLIYANNSFAGAPNNFEQQAMAAFSKRQYEKAAQFFSKAASANPTNYAYIENIGVCYYSNSQFAKAIPYFIQAANFPTATTGKSEFYAAMCYISLGKKDQACALLQKAKAKQYPDAEANISKYCK
jgi:O-antigen ligase